MTFDEPIPDFLLRGHPCCAAKPARPPRRSQPWRMPRTKRAAAKTGRRRKSSGQVASLKRLGYRASEIAGMNRGQANDVISARQKPGDGTC